MEVFRYLPIVHVIDDKVLVIHGGLFGRQGVTLADLDEIDRLDYSPAPPPEPEPSTAAEAREQDLRQLMRDCLWSDPKPTLGCEFNSVRRQGQLFGPDVTEEFLATNGLLMIVRSHECVKRGFDQPYEEMPHLLATIFSASGYSGSNNFGAYMSFSRTENLKESSFVVGGEAGRVAAGGALFFSVHDFTCVEAAETLESRNKSSLRSLILRNRSRLLQEFNAQDPGGSGCVSTQEWGEILQRVTGVVMKWIDLLPLLEIDVAGDDSVDYNVFINDLRNSTTLGASDDTGALFDAM